MASRLEECPTCGHQTSENAEKCPSCGEPLAVGWVDAVRQQREEQAEVDRRAAKEKELALKKKKRKKRLIWAGVLIVLFGYPIGQGMYDDYFTRNMKEVDPTAYETKIRELETKVAKVPASNFGENIRLYKKLLDLNPESKKYSDKLRFYENRKRAADKAAVAAKARKEAAKSVAETAEKAAAVAEKKRKGFHCLSGWDGSHRGVKKYVEKRMRDPDSFEHIETRIAPVSERGDHTLIMKYRSRNGFGGMTVGMATAKIQNDDCSASILTVE